MTRTRLLVPPALLSFLVACATGCAGGAMAPSSLPASTEPGNAVAATPPAPAEDAARADVARQSATSSPEAEAPAAEPTPVAGPRAAPVSAAPAPPPASPGAVSFHPAGSVAGAAGATPVHSLPTPPPPPAPPPAPHAAVKMAGRVAGVSVAGPAPSATARFGADGPGAAPPPAASVKAGEWDDNANYREFQRWLATEASQPFHRVDVRDRQFLVVRDADGKAVPRCPVVVSDAQGHRVTLTSTASGRALLFPHAEGLSGRALTASTSCQSGVATAHFSLDQSDGVVDLKLPVQRVLPATRDLDIAFILDTTGSMGEEIAAVKSTLQKVAASVGGQNVRVRIGMVEYKDRTDPFVTKVYPMTTDVGAFSKQVADLEAGGGGDIPESVNEGLHVGIHGLQWSNTAVAHLAFLIGDAPPHLDYPQDFDYAADMRDAAHQGIQVFTVAASGMDDLGQVVWRQVAEYTGATNLFVLRGGAGPQSTGAGDPKSSCGGTHTQFSSGNLDALILQKVRREIRGLDRDPLQIAGLRTDENAKPCAQRLMIAE